MKKFIISAFIFFISLFCFRARAEIITDMESLREEVEKSVIKSSEVVLAQSSPAECGMSAEKNRIICGICSGRIEILRGILNRGIQKIYLQVIIRNYLKRCRIESECEAVQLQRSENPEDLEYNIRMLIIVYSVIRAKYSDLEAICVSSEDSEQCY